MHIFSIWFFVRIWHRWSLLHGAACEVQGLLSCIDNGGRCSSWLWLWLSQTVSFSWPFPLRYSRFVFRGSPLCSAWTGKSWGGLHRTFSPFLHRTTVALLSSRTSKGHIDLTQTCLMLVETYLLPRIGLLMPCCIQIFFSKFRRSISSPVLRCVSSYRNSSAFRSC